MLKWGNFEEQKIHALPSPLQSKLGCLLFCTGFLNSGTTLHGEDEERKGLQHCLFEVGKMLERLIGQRVSNNKINILSLIVCFKISFAFTHSLHFPPSCTCTLPLKKEKQ